jgi:hypothetical protein
MSKPGESKGLKTRAFRAQVVQSFVALGASAIAFGLLAVTHAFSGGRSAAQGVERIVSGVAIATLAVAAIMVGTILARWWFQRRVRGLTVGRSDAIALEVVRNRRFTRIATAHGHVAHVPFLLELVADQRGIEVWGGMVKPRIIWSTDWSNLSYVDTGAMFDGRTPEDEIVQLVVTGRGLGGLGAIEGEPLERLVSEITDLKEATSSN